MREINDIFKDLAVMVNDQGEKIGLLLCMACVCAPPIAGHITSDWTAVDQIQDYIQSTSDNTEAAGEEVDKAFEAQKKAR